MKKFYLFLICSIITTNSFALTRMPNKGFSQTIVLDGVEYQISDKPFVANYRQILRKDAIDIMFLKCPTFGVIDNKQNIIIPCIYSEVTFEKKRCCILVEKFDNFSVSGSISLHYGMFDLRGNELVSPNYNSPKKAIREFDNLGYTTRQTCVNIYGDILKGIDVSQKQYYAQKPIPVQDNKRQTSSSSAIAQNANTQQSTPSSGGRSYSIEELQALGVIGGGNNNQQPTQQVATTQNSQPQQTTPQRTLSDVDKNIPVTDHRAENTFVLIIANEDYEFVDKVDFAKNDGQTFKEYCVKTLGVPEKQVWLYENATFGKINAGISKMVQAMNMFDAPNAIIYYCGHGIPDEKTSDAYIIPTDGDGKNMATCYSLNKLYTTFANTKAANVTYFMDACFTGASKEGSMLVAARGVAREPKKEVLGGKTVVFSATSSDETAMAYKEKQHGLFTYYLLKKLQETKGDVSYEELSQYIKSNVQKEAFLTNEKPQTPVVATSPAVGSTWKTMKLK